MDGRLGGPRKGTHLPKVPGVQAKKRVPVSTHEMEHPPGDLAEQTGKQADPPWEWGHPRAGPISPLDAWQGGPGQGEK